MRPRVVLAVCTYAALASVSPSWAIAASFVGGCVLIAVLLLRWALAVKLRTPRHVDALRRNRGERWWVEEVR